MNPSNNYYYLPTFSDHPKTKATIGHKKTVKKLQENCIGLILQKPEGEEQGDHILISSFPDGLEVHEDCEIQLPQQPRSPTSPMVIGKIFHAWTT